MKPMFYFLLALTAVLATTSNAGGPVLDFNGDAILGGSYYVHSAYFVIAGGLALSSLGDNQCPLYIQQEVSEVNMGTPVKFSNWKSKVGFVPESESLNIEMDVTETICGKSAYWWVAPFNSPMVSYFIAAVPKPKPGEDSSRSFFRIEKTKEFHNGYNIGFCPNDYSCTYIGIDRDDYGVNRLALGSERYPFVFMKASETETSSKSMSII